VVVDAGGAPLYFSRSPIPFIRNTSPENWHKAHPFYQHLGVYAYRKEALQEITKLALHGLNCRITGATALA